MTVLFWKLKPKIAPKNCDFLGVFYLKVIRYPKTKNIMSKIKISFMGYDDNPASGLKEITATFRPNSVLHPFPLQNRIHIKIKNSDESRHAKMSINLDLKQAIKFCKVLQHEIYKLKEAEVENG
jgi:hypothetical protein